MVPDTINPLNSTMLDEASGVYIAVTMIHEALHAEIFRLVTSWGGSHSNLTKLKWPELYQEYINHFPSAQHEIMAKKFRDEIKQAIIEYDDACGKPLRDPVQLDALSWSGLFNTFSWDAFILTQGYGGNWNNYETMVYNLREWRESNDWNNCKTSTSINVE